MNLPSYLCVRCNQSIEESLMHLFLECPFAQICWSKLQVQIGNSHPFTELESIRNQLNVPFLWILSSCSTGAFAMILFLKGFNHIQIIVMLTSSVNLP